ncbi:MAG: TolC family protein, partial [Longimicrobiales bacterium]
MILSLAVAQADTVALSLAAARARALESNPSLLAERADVRAQRTTTTAATRAFLPTVRAEVSGVRTNDPVAVFGLKLRQARFAGSDLALGALNDPASFAGFSSSAFVEVPVLAPEGWYGYRAARSATAAREAGATRVSGATVFMVTQAYVDAQLAAARVAGLDGALTAVREHARQAELLNRQGLVTGLDARLASLQAADLEVRRLAAAAEAANAVSRLRALIAVPEGTPLVLTDSLGVPVGDAACRDSACAPDSRGDLRALEAGRDAAEAARKSAWAAQLPQVGVFGGVAYHGHDTPWNSGSGDWTLGVSVRWNLFPALSGVAAVRRAAAEREAAGHRYESARRNAEVEVLSAERLLEAARGGAAVAARAAVEAA